MVRRKPIEFILHIGAPKTGTSSIQATLYNNQKTLEKNNIKYLGLILEYAYLKKYNWQKPASIVQFHQMDTEKRNKELCDILDNTIKHARKKNIQKLIWSHESFLGTSDNILPVLMEFEKANKISLKIICYVRDYVKWSKSAYIQWGLKHKSKNGPLLSYNEWTGVKNLYFGKLIDNIIKKYNATVFVRNMESINDVVVDFLMLCDINIPNIQTKRVNDTPSYEELFFRVLYNMQFDTTVRPEIFDKNIKPYLNPNQSIEDYLKTFLPDKKSLEYIQKDTAVDKKILNSILESQSQPVIREGIINDFSIKVDKNKIIKALSELVMHQTVKINLFEERLKKVENILNNETKS